MPYRDPAQKAAWMREYRKRKRSGQVGVPTSLPSTTSVLHAPEPSVVPKQRVETSSPPPAPLNAGFVRKGARGNFKTALELARTFPCLAHAAAIVESDRDQSGVNRAQVSGEETAQACVNARGC